MNFIFRFAFLVSIGLLQSQDGFTQNAMSADDLEEAVPQLELDNKTNYPAVPQLVEAINKQGDPGVPTPTQVPLYGHSVNLAGEQNATSTISDIKNRVYILFDAEKKIDQQESITDRALAPASHNETNNKTYFPNAEASMSLEAKLLNRYILFADAIADYSDQDKKSQIFVNQIGMRGQFAEKIQWAIGKERSRRAPGMLISPSDIIYSQSNLPGQREDRHGVWLGRLSFQEITESYDIYVLHVDSEWQNGLPKSKQGASSFAARVFHQFANVDLSLSIGKIQNINKIGLAIQGLIDNVYKLYTELGTQEYSLLPIGIKKQNPYQTLLGFGYEGSDTFNIKFEYLNNGQGLTQAEFKQVQLPFMVPFARQKYILINLVFPEIRKRYNIIGTSIVALEDNANLRLLRGEYIATDQLLLGASLLEIGGDSNSQYSHRNFDSQLNIDMKYTF
jgi:hypothetical protein